MIKIEKTKLTCRSKIYQIQPESSHVFPWASIFNTGIIFHVSWFYFLKKKKRQTDHQYEYQKSNYVSKIRELRWFFKMLHIRHTVAS